MERYLRGWIFNQIPKLLFYALDPSRKKVHAATQLLLEASFASYCIQPNAVEAFGIFAEVNSAPRLTPRKGNPF